MQLSETPTAHILVWADTNSEFESCNFAIIKITDGWKRDQLKRLEVAKSFANDKDFRSLSFYEDTVDFYQTARHGLPDIEELLGGRKWAFVKVSQEELSEEELDEEEQLNCNLDAYRLVIDFNGDFRYTAKDEYTGYEFWTEEVPLREILEKL